jgi:SAM-dependent methyltransferase
MSPASTSADSRTIGSMLAVDPSIDAEMYNRLVAEYASTYGDRVASYAAGLLAVDHYTSRFIWLENVVDNLADFFPFPMLVSGFSVGSEMIAARRCGFERIHGVEVDRFLVSVTQARLREFPGMFPEFYDGCHLPYADRFFGVVASGHIIEHTADPEKYLWECVRVLRPGGYIALEFPHRYHQTELHTGLPSLEWLPRPIRNLAYRMASARLSPLPAHAKNGYRGILGTGLQQISKGRVRSDLRRSGVVCSIPRSEEVAPGILRILVRRDY